MSQPHLSLANAAQPELAAQRPVVEIEGVTLRYGEKVVLERVSLNVSPGEFVCVIGKSGCGKTTLLRVVAGLARPQEGSVSIVGREVTSPGQDSAMVFQADSLFPWKKVIDNACFGLISASVPEAKARQTALAWLERVGLAESRDLKPRQLSGGMRQRVNLVRALVIQPRVLLMDEPFASVDYQTREELQSELITLCRETRTTVLFVTHDVTEAVYLGDRIVVLDVAIRNIKQTVELLWSRERPLSLKHTGDFAQTCGVVWRALTGEQPT